MNALQIRRASPKDAAGIVEVLEAVAAERIHSAIDQVWTVEQEVRYLESLSRREILYVAVDATAGVVGFQSLDLWSSLLPVYGTRRSSRNISIATMAGTGRWSPIVECHRIVG
jgi:hypothetical protein